MAQPTNANQERASTMSDTYNNIEAILKKRGASYALKVPGIYEIVSDVFNNDVIQELEDDEKPLTQENFQATLEEILDTGGPSLVLSLGDVYTTLSDALNEEENDFWMG